MQAQSLIDDFDIDRSGTIDFSEFLTLMFKIKAGTIPNMAENKLVTALLESKNQIKIFEEIEEIKNNPPAFIGVSGYGGVPVVCDFVIAGPTGTSYENSYYELQVTFETGYPYKAPEVVVKNRIFAVNIQVGLDGTGSIMHLKNVWDSRWNIRVLLTHIVSLLITPNLSLLNPNILHVLATWATQTGKGTIAGLERFSEGNVSKLHENDSYEDMLSNLSRQDQMHLNVLSIYLFDNERFERTVKQMAALFANKNPLAHLGVFVAKNEEGGCDERNIEELAQFEETNVYDKPNHEYDTANEDREYRVDDNFVDETAAGGHYEYQAEDFNLDYTG